MNPLRRRPAARAAALAPALLVAACLGCNDGSVSVSGSTTEAQVHGTVAIRGKPATDGFVVFDPANVRRRDAAIRRVPIGKDGTYQATTLVGENRVSLEGPQITRNGLEIASRRTFEVAAGDNTLDIEVPPSGDPKAAKKGPH